VSDSIAQITQSGGPQDLDTELALLRGEGLFVKAVQQAASELNFPSLVDSAPKLFAMYSAMPNNTDVAAVSAGTNAPVGVVLISAKASDPQVAAAIANAVSSVYNDTRRKSSHDALIEVKAFVQKQLADATVGLADVDKRLALARKRTGLADVVLSTQQRINLQGSIQALKEQNVADLQASEKEVESLATSLGKAPATIVANSVVKEGLELQGLEQSLSQLKQTRATLASQFYEQSPLLKDLDESIARETREISQLKQDKVNTVGGSVTPSPLNEALAQDLATAQSRLASLRSRQAALDSLLTKQQTENAVLSTDTVEVQRLETERMVLNQQYQSARQMSAAYQNQTGTAAITAPVLFPAVPNPVPVSPELPKLVISAVFAAAMLGLAVSFIYESSRQRLYSSRYIASITGLPVVAALPARRLSSADSLAKSNAAINESFRFMAFSTLARPDRGGVVLFTGVGNIPGRANAAVQYAISLSRAGATVLLVDADVQRAGAGRVLDVVGKPGLAEILSGDTLGTEESWIVGTAHPGLSLLPAGAGGKASVDAGLDRFRGLIEDWKQKYDYVVLSMLPCDLSADTAALASSADDVCLVVSGKSTNVDHLGQGLELLKLAGAKRVGIVLTEASYKEESFSASAAVTR
jgi:MinD-like ATPase involved in chromosome partitioning or flagellar assembly/capsular polysaccharide biosynthesis protein